MLVGAVGVLWILCGQLDAAPAASATATHLGRGLRLLDLQEFGEARAALELALDDGPYDHAQVVGLYRGLGLSRAFTGDEDGALWAFSRLLIVAPDESLPYTTSPKATFVFDRARMAQRQQRPAEILVVTEPVLAFDRPVLCRVERRSDPLAAMTHAAVLHRLQGQVDYQTLELELPPPGQRLDVTLPAVPGAAAVVDSHGIPGAILEIAVVARDARGWEIYRGPDPERPLQIPVGFSESREWYTQWWLWGLIGGGVAAVTTGAIVAVLLWPLPDRIPASYEVVR
ncbi:MAG: hypothetical protein ABIJ09_27565 [Pseudomonadota bacterium]